MSSTFTDHHNHQPHHPKREPNENNSVLYPPSPSPFLKLNKDSHVIKKPPSPSSSSSSAKPRHPVIIYTQTPRVIHTTTKDFMSLVQKLTGMSRSDEDSNGNNTTTDPGGGSKINQNTVDRKINRNRQNTYQRSYSSTGTDSESSSVITTDENIGESNSSLPYVAVAIPPPPQHPPSMYDTSAGGNYGGYFSAYSMFPPPGDGFLCGNQPFGSFDDPLFFPPNMRSSFSSSSSSGFDGLAEFRDF